MSKAFPWKRKRIAAEVHGSDLVSREANDGNSDSVATTSLPITSSNPDRSNPGFGAAYISPSSLLPLPKCGPRKTNKKQRKRSTRILTNSPELRKLIISKQNSCRVKQKKRKKVVEKRKETNDQKKRPMKKRKISSAKKVLFDSSESECNEEIKYDSDQDECETIEEKQRFCDICAEPYENTKAGEVWVQCQCSGCQRCRLTRSSNLDSRHCDGWAHELYVPTTLVTFFVIPVNKLFTVMLS